MTILNIIVINFLALSLTVGFILNYSITDLEIDFIHTLNRPVWGYGIYKDEEEEVVDGREIKYVYKDEIYRYDEFLNTNKSYKRHFIIAGGSNAFGHGIPVEETLTRNLRETNRLNDYRIYNYAYRGWSPAAFLARIQNSSDLKRIKETNGVMVFNYFSFHAYRVCGYDSFMRWDKGVSPFYEFNGEHIQHQGRFLTTTKFFNFLMRYPFMSFDKMHEDHGIEMPVDCQRLTVEIIKKLKSEYLEIFPNGKFYVMIPPFYLDYKNIHTIPIQERLSKSNILNYDFKRESEDYLKSNNAIDYPKDFFLEDYHLNGKANFMYSKMLLDYLKI